jgi:hypothetical protein
MLSPNGLLLITRYMRLTFMIYSIQTNKNKNKNTTNKTKQKHKTVQTFPKSEQKNSDSVNKTIIFH